MLNKIVVTALPFIPKPIVELVSRRYIAGVSLPDAVTTVQQLNTLGATATIDVLGEDIFTRNDAEIRRSQSIAVLEEIEKQKLDSNLSIKLTSLGLKIDKNFCRENVESILAVASKDNNFVRIDMEDHTCTDDTLEIFRAVRAKYKNVGIVIQAYLHRSEDDVRKLAAEHANVRVCKGIYNEPPAVAIKDRRGIQQNFVRLLKILFDAKCNVGIATHDDILIDAAKRLIVDYHLRRTDYEFQMLLGVRNERRNQLVAEQHRLRVYTPFGKDWYGYSVRRLKENPHMAGHIFKAFLGLEK